MKQQDKFWFLRERLIFGLVIILSLLGTFTWFNINEQEDPFFPYRNANVTIVAPGMSASAIEDTIVQPFERLLASVDGLNRVSSSVSDGSASVDIELQETVYETELVWQRVREKVSEAQARFASLVSVFELNDRAQDTAGVLLAIDTELSLLEARRYALYVRDELYKLSAIRKIDIIGDPQEQIEVFYPQELMLELGISPQDISRQISQANSLKNIGLLKGRQYQSNIASITRLDNVQALKAVEIKTADNSIMTLSDIAGIKPVLSPVELESFWVNGEQKVGLSIVVPPDQLRVTDFGEALLAQVAKLNAQNDGFVIRPVFFQPEWTEKRRNDLALSLLYSSIGVGIVLFLLMSKKVALVVTLTIPAIALSSIGFFGIYGGVLHQMSIAGLVISLGLMVDNSIVMSELISRYRQQGLGRIAASQHAIKDLYKPLATSTFTTIAAFIPMLLSEGDVADFIRMIPVVVIIAIITSYLYSLALLPAITNNLASFKEGSNSGHFNRLGAKLAQLGTRQPKTVILAFIALVAVSFVVSKSQPGEFFPKTSRNQAFIDIEGSFGLSHGATLQTVRQVEALLQKNSKITDIVSFVGNSGPRFYYNLSESGNEPNIARVVFKTETSEMIPDLVKQLNREFAGQFRSTRVRAREIGQGPLIEAPIEIRVLGDDRKKLLTASEEIFALLNAAPATIDSRRGYVVGKPKLTLDIDELNLQKAGITRSELSAFIAWRTTGMHITNIPMERESVRVMMRDHQNINRADSDYIMNSILMNNQGQAFPLTTFARQTFTGEAPVLKRWGGFNSYILMADVKPGFDAEQVLASLAPALKNIAEQYQLTLAFGGQAEEESGSNAALIKTLPIGAILLFGALILQFNSYRIAALIMLTIPLAMIGVTPTLSMAGVTFGFMSVLGLLALTGIVVNTAIILIDTVVVKIREEGASLLNAIEQATQERFRPVLLTACTTIIGMIPLTSPSSPLWPPLAWTIIGGLITSTVLTLIVLPALLKLMLNENKIRGGQL
ncbi:efflux RND transporter permease subunit [Thalassomonas sp. RHCl1]|uniref:efflux RND transporter permease subunit n=1 Tax=Thalassomonas sp. RHCl1 TaxID=2995320 RepID=UPI00248A9B34|nr:efflux RND transporter permease subunit [Thalassomonas sp. RHCl1]